MRLSYYDLFNPFQYLTYQEEIILYALKVISIL